MLAAMLILALAGSEPAPAADPPPPPPVPATEWARKATGSDFAASYPQNAADKRVSGRVVMECVTDAKGALTDCKVVQETPPGWGFGAAGLKVAKAFRVKNPQAGAVVRLPLRWNMMN